MNYKDFIKYLIIALCSAVVTFFSSCTAGVVIGHNQKQYQEQTISTSVDSSRIVPTLQIR